MQIDPLGGCLDDLLVEVAKAHLLRDASRDRLTFGAREMRHADDSVRRRHLLKFMRGPGRESPAGGHAAPPAPPNCPYGEPGAATGAGFSGGGGSPPGTGRRL